MDTRIYVITHKEFIKPDGELYIPLQVGHAISGDLGYQADDDGENISSKNKSYCELTGIYWIWKNVKCDIVGICHYRRYFVHDKNFITKEYIEKVLANYDVIVSDCGQTKYESLREHYRAIHQEKDLDICRNVLCEKYPEYTDAFDLCMSCNLFTLGNMLITHKSMFDSYCVWLFDILFEVERRVDISGYDEFQKRIFGYLSERLLRVWLLYHEFKIHEEKVELIDPKDSENAAKIVQMKHRYVELMLKDIADSYSIGNPKDVVDLGSIQHDFEGKIPVWVCWWQGLDSAPEIVRMCINSIERNLPDICRLQIITIENVQKYVTFPKWVIEKVNAEKISLAHLSDMLRFGLLYRYGGLWLDATYYVASPIPKEWFDDGDFFTHRLKESPWHTDITQGRWSINLICGKAGNPLFRYMINAMYLYWQYQDQILDYFLTDYIMALGYDRVAGFRKYIDEVPYSQPHLLELRSLLSDKFSIDKWNQLIEDTCMFKLNHRDRPLTNTIVEEDTFYGYLLKMS